MSGLGTDVLAVVCIMGGAAVSGGATLAALRSQPAADPVACTSMVVTAPRVSVRSDGPEVVVHPRAIRVHGTHGCASVVVDGDVRVRIDEARVRAEAARVRVERARERIEAARVRAEAARVRAEGARARADAARSGMTAVQEALEQARLRSDTGDPIQAQLEKELARVEKELARLNGGGEGR